MHLFFIRHGQSVNNLLWETHHSDDYRNEDPELSETGFRQADLLAEYLAQWQTEPAKGEKKSEKITHLYCSLMLRAIQTGLPVAARLGLPLVGLEDVCEVGGIHLLNHETGEDEGLPGKTRSYFRERFPQLVLPESVSDAGWWNREHETQEASLPRVRRFLDFLRQKHGTTDDRVIVISHGNFFTRFINVFLGMEDFQGSWFLMNNTGITDIYFGKDDYCIMYQNRLEHLPADLVT